MSDERFILEINQPMGWVVLCYFNDLDIAVAYCRLYAMSEKTTARLREDDHNVVYEVFYDRSQDPDAQDWDNGNWDVDREDFDISWQECGF
jgi:hypothetical protein